MNVFMLYERRNELNDTMLRRLYLHLQVDRASLLTMRNASFHDSKIKKIQRGITDLEDKIQNVKILIDSRSLSANTGGSKGV